MVLKSFRFHVFYFLLKIKALKRGAVFSRLKEWGEEKSWKGDESIWRLRKKRERPWLQEKTARAQIARNLEKRETKCIWGAQAEEATHTAHVHVLPIGKTTFQDKLSSWGQYRIWLTPPFPLISTPMDSELWCLSCRCICFFTVSASSAVIVLRTQRTTVQLGLTQQIWKEMHTSLTVLLSYLPLLCLLLPPQHLLHASSCFVLVQSQN